MSDTIVVDKQKMQKLYETLLKSDNPYANDVLDLMDSANASTEILDDIEKEVDEMDEKLTALEELNNYFSEMSVDEIKAMAELVSNATVNQELQNAPITNEVREQLAKDQAESMANAINAAYDAKHPIKFAFGQMGASLSVIKNIPSQMRDNITVARAAGLDCNTSLQNAAIAIASKTTDVFNATKSSISRNATKIANGTVEIYNKAVENTVSAWEKGKSKMENLIHKATRGFDIGMEAITLGGWSKFCTNAAIRADIANKNGNYNYNKQLVNAEKKGFEGGKKLFGVNLDDNKLVGIKEKAVNFLATAFTRLHGNMEGLETNKGLSNEGRTTRNQEFVDYWKDTKGIVWGKASDVREEASGVKGNFGSTSPMDVLASKAKEVSDGATNMYKTADKKMHTGFDAAKEMGNKTKDFFKELPGKIKNGVIKAKDAICNITKNIAADIVEYSGKGACAFLKGVSNLSHKAELFDRSQARSLEDVEKTLNNDIERAKGKIDNLSADLERINGKKVQASVEIPNELAEAKAQLMAASPTANIAKAIDRIEKEEKDITNKANRKAAFHNAGVTLKNAGVIVSDKVQMAYLEASIEDASKKIKSLAPEKDLVNKEADMFGRWSNKISESGDNAKTKTKELADKIRGKGRGDGGDGNDGPPSGVIDTSNYEKEDENMDMEIDRD